MCMRTLGRMHCGVVAWLLASGFLFAADSPNDQPHSPGRPDIVLVVGAPGESRYEATFRQWTADWQKLAATASIRLDIIDGLPPEVVVDGSESEPFDQNGVDQDPTDQSSTDQPAPDQQEPSDSATSQAQVTQKERLRQAIEQARDAATDPLWIVLIGHGTFDGRVARFNLVGPDVASAELKQWLADVARPVAVLNCSSSSAPFVADLAGANRVVITATRSGHEYQFARLGGFIASALLEGTADLDKDGQTSLLEAFLFASRQVQAYYRQEGLLATEHALIEDNGDGQGTPADWFDGVAVLREAAGGQQPDGGLAHQWHLMPTGVEAQLTDAQRAQRAELEQQLILLRKRKDKMDEGDYLRALEAILVPLARLYADAATSDSAPDGTSESEPSESAAEQTNERADEDTEAASDPPPADEDADQRTSDEGSAGDSSVDEGSADAEQGETPAEPQGEAPAASQDAAQDASAGDQQDSDDAAVSESDAADAADGSR